MSVYPSADIERNANHASPCEALSPCALISAVEEDSPAYEVGFEPGCKITAVNGQPLRDIIDWRWLTAGEDEICLGYIDLDGEEGEVELYREEGEDWGIEFEGFIFDRVKLCRNACSFCFMRMLPPAMRPSLSLRDDDFRLSFLSGTFVTLTNLSAQDEARILEQRISPLRVSLHAFDGEARLGLIGKHAQHGLDALERLLEGGIEVHAQIVLVPGVNDGEVLEETLRWAWGKPGILNIGIVPLGYTRFQDRFEKSFNDPADARAVIESIVPYQERARTERADLWVYAADEFYRNAFGTRIGDHLPSAEDYGDFSMFEDGIGIVRSYLDEFAHACESGLAQRAADALDASGAKLRFVVGGAMQPFLDDLVQASPLAGRLVPLTVENRYFGGNVDVTGLLCAADMVDAIRAACSAPDGEELVFAIPSIVFNDNGVTLDDASVTDMEKASGHSLRVVSCNPLDYLAEIIDLLSERAGE